MIFYKKYKLVGGIVPNINNSTIFDKFDGKTLLLYDQKINKYIKLYKYKGNNNNDIEYVILNEIFELVFDNIHSNIVDNNSNYNDIINIVCSKKYIQFRKDVILYSDIILINNIYQFTRLLNIFIVNTLGINHKIKFINDHFNIVSNTNEFIYLGISRKYNILGHYLFINRLKEFLDWTYYLYYLYSEYKNKSNLTIDKFLKTVFYKEKNIFSDLLTTILNDIYDYNLNTNRFYNINDYIVTMSNIIVTKNNKVDEKFFKNNIYDDLNSYIQKLIADFNYMINFINYSREQTFFIDYFNIHFDHLMIFGYINERLLISSINRPDVEFEILPINKLACIENLLQSSNEKNTEKDTENITNEYTQIKPPIYKDHITVKLNNIQFSNCVEHSIYQLIKFLIWDWDKGFYNITGINDEYKIYFESLTNDMDQEFTEKINSLEQLSYVKNQSYEVEPNIKNFIMVIKIIFNLHDIKLNNANDINYNYIDYINDDVKILENIFNATITINNINTFLIELSHYKTNLKIKVNIDHSEVIYTDNTVPLHFLNLSNILKIDTTKNNYNLIKNNIDLYSENNNKLNVSLAHLYYNIYNSHNFKYYDYLTNDSKVSYFFSKYMTNICNFFYEANYVSTITHNIVKLFLDLSSIDNIKISNRLKENIKIKFKMDNFLFENETYTFIELFLLELLIYNFNSYQISNISHILNDLQNMCNKNKSNLYNLLTKIYNNDQQIYLSQKVDIFCKINDIIKKIINNVNSYHFIFPDFFPDIYNNNTLINLNDPKLIESLSKHYFLNFTTYEPLYLNNLCMIINSVDVNIIKINDKTKLENKNSNMFNKIINLGNELVKIFLFHKNKNYFSMIFNNTSDLYQNVPENVILHMQELLSHFLGPNSIIDISLHNLINILNERYNFMVNFHDNFSKYKTNYNKFMLLIRKIDIEKYIVNDPYVY